MVNIKTDKYGFRVYGWYVGYTEKAVLTLAGGFPKDWEIRLTKE